MKAFVFVVVFSICNLAIAKDSERKRNYPGGRDEQDLMVQPQLQKNNPKADTHDEGPAPRQPSSVSESELFNE